MYLSHFHLAERPFSITPDPRFVYLSERHREALAHLLYGLGDGGGFVQLTGEVGTGKTTICRSLLHRLPEHVDAALIFNPQLSIQELLETLCAELGIPLPDGEATAKTLMDRLYGHLLAANARGRRTVLIVDEAQNLSPELLEEIRLLTNLETDDSKLLQIFLIGQPELRRKLASPALRQIAQRITARYHLEPLDLDETRHYIRHRLAVAGCPYEVFTGAAIRKVHRLCGGIPRRINILCDRALLGAYSTDARRVSAAIVRRAHAEIDGRQPARLRPLVRRTALALAVAAAVLVALPVAGPWLEPASAWIERMTVDTASTPLAGSSPADKVPAQSDSAAAPARVTPGPETVTQIPAEWPGVPDAAAVAPVASTAMAADATSELSAGPQVADAAPTPALLEPSAPPASAPPPSPPTPPPPTLDELIAGLAGDGWSHAASALIGLWGVEPAITSTDDDLCVWARGVDLACHSASASWPALQAVGLPAILRLAGPDGADVFALLTGLDEDQGAIRLGVHEQTVARAELERRWRGEYLVLWRPPFDSRAPIQLGHTGERVRWLRDTFAAIDGTDPPTPGATRFDATLRARVTAFQRSHGLQVDGIVGPQTLFHLSTRSASGGDGPDPRLRSRGNLALQWKRPSAMGGN